MWRCHGLLQYRPFGPGKGMTLSSPASDFQEIDFGESDFCNYLFMSFMSFWSFRPMLDTVTHKLNETLHGWRKVILGEIHFDECEGTA